MSVSFKRLLEQTIDSDGLFSPFYTPVKTMEPEEVDLLDEHPTIPSENTSEIPPSQVEWQWQEGDMIYNAHLVKEIYSDDRKLRDIHNPDTPKRYKILTFVYHNQNNQVGLATKFSGTSDTFGESYNTEVLSNFLDDMEFLEEAETGGEERLWFSRLVEPQF